MVSKAGSSFYGDAWRHSGAVVSTVTSEQEDPGSDSGSGRFCVEFACSISYYIINRNIIIYLIPALFILCFMKDEVVVPCIQYLKIPTVFVKNIACCNRETVANILTIPDPTKCPPFGAMGRDVYRSHPDSGG